VLRDVRPYNPAKVIRIFGATYHLQLQGRRERQARNQQESGPLIRADFLLDLLFDPEDGGDMFLRNVVYLSPDYMALHPRHRSSKPLLLALSFSPQGVWNVSSGFAASSMVKFTNVSVECIISIFWVEEYPSNRKTGVFLSLQYVSPKCR
jgi:hypothetical protein